ncbi:hypothetical protein [Methylobacterium iners]|nr:hypothetical protein [Methylobacterium iners]
MGMFPVSSAHEAAACHPAADLGRKFGFPATGDPTRDFGESA